MDDFVILPSHESQPLKPIKNNSIENKKEIAENYKDACKKEDTNFEVFTIFLDGDLYGWCNNIEKIKKYFRTFFESKKDLINYNYTLDENEDSITLISRAKNSSLVYDKIEHQVTFILTNKIMT